MLTPSVARLATAARFALLACPLLIRAAPEVGDWPAEPEAEATNLTELTKKFERDLSGAVWNPVTNSLWVCSNGPEAKGRLWKLERDGAGEFQIASRDGARAVWKGFRESEGLTFADFAEELVYAIIEDTGTIHELDVSSYGEQVLVREYDTREWLSPKGSDGAEGITFVPDRFLTELVASDGEPRTSRNGMGGLMLVGHQRRGGIFAFDLDRETGAVDFVGEYRVLSDGSPLKKVVALEFDRSSGRLYAWHGLDGGNLLSVLELDSKPVAGESYRSLEPLALYRAPSERDFEGLALAPTEDCTSEGRALFLTVDDGKRHALFRYAKFRPGCGPK